MADEKMKEQKDDQEPKPFPEVRFKWSECWEEGEVTADQFIEIRLTVEDGHARILCLTRRNSDSAHLHIDNYFQKLKLTLVPQDMATLLQAVKTMSAKDIIYVVSYPYGVPNLSCTTYRGIADEEWVQQFRD